MSDTKYKWKQGAVNTRRFGFNRSHCEDVQGEVYGPVGLHEEGGMWRITDLDSGMRIKSFPFDGMVEGCKQEDVARRCAEYIAPYVVAMVDAKKELADNVKEFVELDEYYGQ